MTPDNLRPGNLMNFGVSGTTGDREVYYQRKLVRNESSNDQPKRKAVVLPYELGKAMHEQARAKQASKPQSK